MAWPDADTVSAGTLADKAPGRGNQTAAALWYIVLAGMITMTVVAGAGVMDATASGWIVLILSSMVLWACWLYWRIARAQPGVPGHILQPFLAIPILVLIGHIVAGGRIVPAKGGVDPSAGSDSGMLIRMMTLSLLVLLTQDVLSRVRNIRWLLTVVGLAVAVGAVLRLNTGRSSQGAEALTLAGLAGVGMMLAPCCLPAWRLFGDSGRYADDTFDRRIRRLLHAELVVRVGVSAALAALLCFFSGPRSAQAAAIATLATGAVLLPAGAFLRHHRLRLLLFGAILTFVGAAAVIRAGTATIAWGGSATLLGGGSIGHDIPSAMMSGMGVLFASAGWIGLGAVVCGMAAALIWSLYVSRGASAGDQARCAVWATVVALSGCALMTRGGLSTPLATVVFAVTWGLMPHVMAHPVRRYAGWGVTAAFLAALTVMGLESSIGRFAWIRPLLRESSDAMMHFFGAFLLAAVLFWQCRCRTWRRAVLWTVIAGFAAAMGEPAQKYLSTRSPQLSDVGWDLLGSAGALAVFLLIGGVRRIERILSSRPRVSLEDYR